MKRLLITAIFLASFNASASDLTEQDKKVLDDIYGVTVASRIVTRGCRHQVSVRGREGLKSSDCVQMYKMFDDLVAIAGALNKDGSADYLETVLTEGQASTVDRDAQAVQADVDVIKHLLR
jgi:hypothetical protein